MSMDDFTCNGFSCILASCFKAFYKLSINMASGMGINVILKHGAAISLLLSLANCLFSSS